MKAITVRQPFATRLVRGVKPYEFRSWKTAFRGPIVIHAARAMFSGDFTVMKGEENLPRGAIVGAVTIVDCVPIDDHFGFKIGHFIECDPVEAKGTLGIYTYDKQSIRMLPSSVAKFFKTHGG